MRVALALLVAVAAISAAAHPLRPRDASAISQMTAHIQRRDAPPGDKPVNNNSQQQPASPPPPPPAPSPSPAPEASHPPDSQQQQNQPPQQQQGQPQQQQQGPPQQSQSQPQQGQQGQQQNGGGDSRPNDNQHGNDQSGAGTPPVHEHFEHVDHPGGDPNNINMVTQDIVNDDRNGVHSNVVQHVAINGNNINGQHGVKVVNGANGVVINDQGNRATAPNGSVQVSGSDGPVVATH